jgi:hypothetical protein
LITIAIASQQYRRVISEPIEMIRLFDRAIGGISTVFAFSPRAARPPARPASARERAAELERDATREHSPRSGRAFANGKREDAAQDASLLRSSLPSEASASQRVGRAGQSAASPQTRAHARAIRDSP